LSQCIKILGHYDIVFLSPEYLSLIDIQGKYSIKKIERFNKEFFLSTKTYNKLMLSGEFYARFSKYKYILIHQLDAFVFEDNLLGWCALNQDYIGAPWFGETWPSEVMKNTPKPLWAKFPLFQWLCFKKSNLVGNGGLSLRKVSSALRVLGILKKFVSTWGMNEDVFWSVYVPNVLPFFKVPDVATAARFSLELYPRFGFEMNGNVLPFGCHAWDKWDPEFWHAHIEAQVSYLDAVGVKLKQRMKVSVITPTSNSAKYLDRTMSSVVSQVGNFDIEYIVVDNASTDDTRKIFESYRGRLKEINRQRRAGEITLTMISQPDRGMYEAINHGFSLATGDIFAWINADDLYLPGAFEQVVRVFAMSGVMWLKGITSYIDERGRTLSHGRCYLYAQQLLRRGLYGREAYFVQQDSVFWRADLWNASGGLDASFRLAGDYDLWMRFAEQVPLYTLNVSVSSFRNVPGQLSEDLVAYRAEQDRIVRPRTFRDRLLHRFFKSVEPKLPDWLNSLGFRALCPFDKLYIIDVDSGNVSMRQSFKYKV